MYILDDLGTDFWHLPITTTSVYWMLSRDEQAGTVAGVTSLLSEYISSMFTAGILLEVMYVVYSNTDESWSTVVQQLTLDVSDVRSGVTHRRQ